jgi:hypothetical protein
MKLRIGDKVRFLNEVGEGIISRIKDHANVFVEMPDGFEIPYHVSQLVPIHTELIIDKDAENIELDPEGRVTDAVYFAIEPDHELPQLISDYKLYLFNSSSFNVLYTYSVKDEQHFQTIKHGDAGPYQKVLLRQVKMQFFKDYPSHLVECIFYKNSFFRAQPPVSLILKLSPESLRQSYRIGHDEFRFPVYAFMLRDEFLTSEKIDAGISNEDIERLKAIRSFKSAKKQSLSKKQSAKKIEKEVDLHIEELIENPGLLSNHEKLSIQLEKFEKELDQAIGSGIKKIIFIHGVGNGRLRQEIQSFLRNVEGVTWQDASFKEYGYGATQVNIL